MSELPNFHNDRRVRLDLFEPAPDLSPTEAATVARFDNAPPAPESWRLNRCGIKECDQFGTQRVNFPESWYLMCAGHAVQYEAAR